MGMKHHLSAAANTMNVCMQVCLSAVRLCAAIAFTEHSVADAPLEGTVQFCDDIERR